MILNPTTSCCEELKMVTSLSFWILALLKCFVVFSYKPKKVWREENPVAGSTRYSFVCIDQQSQTGMFLSLFAAIC